MMIILPGSEGDYVTHSYTLSRSMPIHSPTMSLATRSLSRGAAIVGPLARPRFKSTGTTSSHPLAKTGSDASPSHEITITEHKEVLTAEVVSGAPRE